MQEEYLDLDSELLDISHIETDPSEDLSPEALGLQDELADQMGLESNLPNFVSSLEEPVENKTVKEESTAETFAEDTEDEPDLISIILKSKGVEDPSKIRMYNDAGEIEEVSFNDLDYETQVNILTSKEEEISDVPKLNEDELELISFLRQNELTVEELLEKQRSAILEEMSEQVGRVDFEEISDEELYFLELKSTYNLLDEEAELLVNKEKEHPELFAKKVNKLREDYKEAEKERERAELESIEEQKQLEYEEFSTGLFETAKGIDEIGGLTLSDKDRQEVLESILSPGADGVSQFTKLFNDRESFFKMAWFAIKGKEAFEMLHSHYKNVIEESRANVKKNTTKPTKLTFKTDVKGLKTSPLKSKKDNVSDAFIIDAYV